MLKKQGLISSFLTILFLILGLFLVSLQLHILGVYNYGLLILLLSIFGSLNILNMGIGNALVKYYTINNGIFLLLFFILLFLISFIGIVLIIISSSYYNEIYTFLKINNQNLNIFSFFGAAIIGLNRMLGSIISSYWLATIDFFKLKIFNFFNNYISIVFILIFFRLEFDFNKTLFLSGIINSIFIIMVSIFILLSEKKNFKLLASFKDTYPYFKDFLINGSQFQGIYIINILSAPIINMLLTKTFGLDAVSFFDVALKLLRSGRQAIVAFSEPFFSKITELNNKRKNMLINLLIAKYTKYMFILSLLYIFIYLLCSRFILDIWVGSDISKKVYIIVYVIAVGFGVNIITSIIYYSYLAMEKYRRYVFIHQMLLFVLSVLPFLLKIKTLIEYSMFYSFSYILSSIYFMYIFYKNLQKG